MAKGMHFSLGSGTPEISQLLTATFLVHFSSSYTSEMRSMIVMVYSKL